MSFKISKEALSLIHITQPFGYRVNYTVLGPRNQTPEVEKIYRFFSSTGSLLNFHHTRHGPFKQPGFEGFAIFKSKEDALKILEKRLHPIDQLFSVEAFNKLKGSPEPIIRYFPDVFRGFHPESKLETLSPKLINFPSLKGPGKNSQRFFDGQNHRCDN